jgi:hypothetical protein
MTRLAFPSEEFPAQPAFTLQIPQDWEPIHSPNSVMAARRVAQEGTFAPNVVVRIERRPADFELNDALAELEQFAAGRPQGVTSEPFKAELDGRVFVGCDLAWVDDQVGTVLQAHLLGGFPLGPYVQLVQFTGSVGGAQANQDFPTIKAIMMSLTVAEPQPGAF